LYTNLFTGFLLALVIGGCTSSPSIPDIATVQASIIWRAAFAGDTLYLLSQDGSLSTIVLGRQERLDAGFPNPVFDLWAQSGVPYVISCDSKTCANWTLNRQSGGSWTTAATIETEGDEYVAAAHNGSRVAIITSRRVIEFIDDKAIANTLSAPLRKWRATSAHLMGDYVLVGYYGGEWGGGLERVELRTGTVRQIESKVAGDTCEGPLNTECDPVNGIAEEPWNPECAAVAVGLIHFVPHGRIVEVCGDRLKRLFFKPTSRNRSGTDTFETEAFFGLVSRGNSLLAAGTQGIYKIGSNGETTFIRYPKLHAVGGVYVSFDVSDVALVASDRPLSVGGGAIMMVPR
jgi:hypothetical protein